MFGGGGGSTLSATFPTYAKSFDPLLIKNNFLKNILSSAALI